MDSILFNIKDLLKYNINIPEKILKDTKNIQDDIGIIFIYSNIYNIKQKKYNPEELITLLKSNEFLSNVYSIYYIIYNSKHKICELRDNIEKKHIIYVIHSIDIFLPNDIFIWSGIIHPEDFKFYIKEGFNHPYKCNKSPLGFKYKTPGVSFLRKKNIINDKNTILNKLQYIKEDTKDNCQIYAQFSKESIKYLKKLIFKNESSDSYQKKEKELSGSLLIKKVIKINDKIIFKIYSHPDSVIIGEDEEVDAVWSRINFHTHPKQAYINNGVTNGWPSSQDYMGFLNLKHETIFHTVVTMEGLYLISFSLDWIKKHGSNNIKTINKKWVLKKYDIDHIKNISPLQYTSEINNIKHKNIQLFKVLYMPWNKSNKIFPIYFAKTLNNCLATDDVFDITNIKL